MDENVFFGDYYFLYCNTRVESNVDRNEMMSLLIPLLIFIQWEEEDDITMSASYLLQCTIGNTLRFR